MNKTAIKNFAIWARNKLIADIQYRAGLMGITAEGIKAALPQSTTAMEFYDIGTAEPYSIAGNAIRQRKRLVEIISQKEKDSDYPTAYKYILEEVAYTWFNRLIAIRFMEVNDYLPSHIRVLSSESGKVEPDLVTTPFDAGLNFSTAEEETILQLKTENQLDELFRLLFIKQCNALNEILPALFEKTSDYTELLLSLSVVDREGVVYRLVHDIDEDDFIIEKGGQVEIIGWLYQYYNTEPKNAAFAKRGKISQEELPAVTQLFTPDWIVRYMVENSLGRIFVDKRKNEGVYADGRGLDEMTWDEAEAMRIANEEDIAKEKGWKYFLPEAAQTQEVRHQLDKIQLMNEYKNVQDIKIIDPCMGSGHILVYAFDVLMQIYEDQGWSQRDAAQSILEHNLYGLDIDDRAAQLAYFAVMMKARQYDRRILARGITPHIHSIAESNAIGGAYKLAMGDFLLSKEHQETLNYLLEVFYDAKEYGSILQLESRDYAGLLEAWKLTASQTAGNFNISLWYSAVEHEIPKFIEQAIVLTQKYDVVVTNPPYMGSGNMGDLLSNYVKSNYPNSKSDMSTVFMEQCQNFCNPHGMYFRQGMTWSTATMSKLSMRFSPVGFLFESKGSVCFPVNNTNLHYLLALLNTKIVEKLLLVLAPTVDYHEGPLGRIPVILSKEHFTDVSELCKRCICLSKKDWDAFEISWDFQRHPLTPSACERQEQKNSQFYSSRIEKFGRIAWHYEKWELECEDRFVQLKANEEELNHIFINIYGLQDELTPEVADKDVTVHRIFDTKHDVPESMQGSSYVRTKRDEIVSLLSYAVGCMFGRYTIYADRLFYVGGPWEYGVIVEKLSESARANGFEPWNPSGLFLPDEYNVIPITDEEYLKDDIITRLCDWLKTVYGADTLEENLDFIAGVLGNKGDSSREIIRNYFLKDFFKDHCKTYQKRPIYWLFDSGKQNGFKSLIYLHRYTPDTIGNLRVDYLHKMQRVYESEISRMQDMIDNSQNAREVAASTKRKEKLQKQLKECRDYDEMIAHLALSRIELDLDDGVKINYEKVQTASDGKKYPVLAKI